MNLPLHFLVSGPDSLPPHQKFCSNVAGLLDPTLTNPTKILQPGELSTKHAFSFANIQTQWLWFATYFVFILCSPSSPKKGGQTYKSTCMNINMKVGSIGSA